MEVFNYLLQVTQDNCFKLNSEVLFDLQVPLYFQCSIPDCSMIPVPSAKHRIKCLYYCVAKLQTYFYGKDRGQIFWKTLRGE